MFDDDIDIDEYDDYDDDRPFFDDDDAIDSTAYDTQEPSRADILKWKIQMWWYHIKHNLLRRIRPLRNVRYMFTRCQNCGHLGTVDGKECWTCYLPF
jgi:hypothetical protein